MKKAQSKNGFLLLFLLSLLLAAHGQESLSTQFKVWPPETEIFKQRPGVLDGAIKVGQGGETIHFSLEKDFSNNPTGSITMEFRCSGYDSESLKVEAAQLTSEGEFYKPVTLSPIGKWMSVKDFLRKNRVLMALFSGVCLLLLGLGFSKFAERKRSAILSELSGDGSWTEKADYILLDKIGSGATASTWRCIRKSDVKVFVFFSRAHDPEFLAIKILEKDSPDEIDKDTGLDLETRREIESIARCDHPVIIRIVDYGLVPNSKGYQPYIVMEYAKGANLHTLVKSGRRFSVKEMLKVAKQLCSGLEHLHDKGAVHRDIKTENFIVSDDLKVKIVDLGLAKTLEERDKLTALSMAAGGFKGTGGYAPPWQMGATEAAPSFDQYATAVCLAEMLAGSHPFELPTAYQSAQGHLRTASRVMFQEFTPLTKYRDDLPESLCSFFEDYFQAKSSDEVYASMAEFYEKLEAATKLS